MELIEVERVPYQGGSLIGTVQHIGGPFSTRQSVSELLNYEQIRRFDSPETIENFSNRLDKLVLEFNQLISRWESEGYEIAGYGAARSNPTLLAQFKIGNKTFWDHHKQNFNYSYDEDNQPFSVSAVKKNRPVINVKKNVDYKTF